MSTSHLRKPPADVKAGREHIRPFADKWGDLVITAEETLEGLTDAEIEEVQAAVNWFSPTNCGWTEFAVSKDVIRKALYRERLRRERKAAEA